MSESVKQILNEGYEFYELNESNCDENINDSKYSIIYGYPNTKTKINKIKKRIKRTAFNYITTSVEKRMVTYNKPWTLQLNLIKNKVVRFPEKDFVKGPKLVGLSGCGIWTYSKNDF
jgi:hypothetical protein